MQRCHGCSVTATVDRHNKERHWGGCHGDTQCSLQHDKQSLQFCSNKLRPNVCKQGRKRQHECREKSLRGNVALVSRIGLVCYRSSNTSPHTPSMRPQCHLVDKPSSFVLRSSRRLRFLRDRDITAAKQSSELIGRPCCLTAGTISGWNVQDLMKTFQCCKRHLSIRAQRCWLDVFQQQCPCSEKVTWKHKLSYRQHVTW